MEILSYAKKESGAMLQIELNRLESLSRFEVPEVKLVLIDWLLYLDSHDYPGYFWDEANMPYEKNETLGMIRFILATDSEVLNAMVKEAKERKGK